jgi:hypothetical protein
VGLARRREENGVVLDLKSSTFLRLSGVNQRCDVHPLLKQGEDFTVKVWTESAIATEYKETLAIENDPEKKEKWLARQNALADHQIELDERIFSAPPSLGTDENNSET